jgi:hypothetical protein
MAAERGARREALQPAGSGCGPGNCRGSAIQVNFACCSTRPEFGVGVGHELSNPTANRYDAFRHGNSQRPESPPRREAFDADGLVRRFGNCRGCCGRGPGPQVTPDQLAFGRDAAHRRYFGRVHGKLVIRYAAKAYAPWLLSVGWHIWCNDHQRLFQGDTHAEDQFFPRPKTGAIQRQSGLLVGDFCHYHHCFRNHVGALDFEISLQIFGLLFDFPGDRHDHFRFPYIRQTGAPAAAAAFGAVGLVCGFGNRGDCRGCGAGLRGIKVYCSEL